MKKKREVFIERKVYDKCTTSLANRSIKVSAVPKVQKLCLCHHLLMVVF